MAQGAVHMNWQSVLPDNRLADMHYAAGAAFPPIIGEVRPETDRVPRPVTGCSNVWSGLREGVWVDLVSVSPREPGTKGVGNEAVRLQSSGR
jgi:hypothetical protein